MPYRKDTVFAPFAMERFLKQEAGAPVLEHGTAREFARVMDEVGIKIAHLAVMNAKKEGRMTVYSRDIRNAVKNPVWREKFAHGQEVCPKCGRPGYVIAKTPKKTSQKEYTYIYVKHGFGNVQQCIAGRLVSSRNPNPLASRDGNGLSVPALEKCNEHESACSLLRELSTCMTSKDLKYKRSDMYH